MQPAVIFDLDGTLIDSAADIHATAQRVFAPYGHNFTPSEVQGCVGRGAPHLVAQLAKARGMAFEGPAFAALLSDFTAIYEGAQGLTRLYPGVRQALEGLAATGCRLGLCTNKPLAPTQAVLRHFRLQDQFQVVIAGDSLAVKKPDPAPLLAALQQLGGGPSVFVGDSEVDAETAMAARIPFLLFTEGYRKSPVSDLPHLAAFSDFNDLAALIRAPAAP